MKIFPLIAITLLATTTQSFARDLVCITDRSQVLFGIKFNDDLTEVLALESADKGFAPGVVQMKITQKKIIVNLNRGRSGYAHLEVSYQGDAEAGKKVYAGKVDIKGFDTQEINTNGVDTTTCRLDGIRRK